MTITVDRPSDLEGRPAPALRYVPCPDGLPWCQTHEADPDGAQYHHGAYVPSVTAGPSALVARGQVPTYEVTCARLDTVDEQTLPVVWLFPSDPGETDDRTVGFTPDSARALAAALIAAADNVTMTRAEEAR